MSAEDPRNRGRVQCGEERQDYDDTHYDERLDASLYEEQNIVMRDPTAGDFATNVSCRTGNRGSEGKQESEHAQTIVEDV
jgi:hypothetical protein